MIAHRLIPLFLLKGKRLVKGTCFKDHIDVGDPLSQAMIYDAQGADEIAIVDIDASKTGGLIDTSIIEAMISKCRLPIAAGGGIKSLDDARKCFAAGADKIIVNTHAILRPGFVKELAAEFGSQSVVVSIDVKKDGKNGRAVYVYSGTRKIEACVEDVVKDMVDNAAGELIITAIDRDGTLSGYDIELYKRLRDLINVPAIASGGAGSYDHIVDLFDQTGFDACAIGKMLFLRDYDMVRIKSYLKGRSVLVREA